MGPKAKHYPQEIVDEGHKILAKDGTDAPMTVTMDMIEFLLKHNYAVKEKHHAREFLVHRKNRGGVAGERIQLSPEWHRYQNSGCRSCRVAQRCCA